LPRARRPRRAGRGDRDRPSALARRRVRRRRRGVRSRRARAPRARAPRAASAIRRAARPFGERSHAMTIARELMTPYPITIRADATVHEAARTLATLDVRHLPVIDEEGALVGMLSDRDLRMFALPTYVEGEYVGDVQTALGASVSTLMSGNVLSV